MKKSKNVFYRKIEFFLYLVLKFVQFCKFLNFESKFLDLEYGKTASMSQFAKNLKSTHPSVQFGWIFAKLGKRNCSRTFEKKNTLYCCPCPPHTVPKIIRVSVLKLSLSPLEQMQQNTVQYEYVWFMVFTV